MLEHLSAARAQAMLSPSARVIVASASRDGGASQASVLPWRELHWPTLVSLTAFERAEAQVFRLLRAAPVGDVPDDVLQAMQGIFRVSAFRAAELADAASGVADALTAHGIEALWLKGAALAMQSPDDFSLRSMGDLDLLVGLADSAKARVALRLIGWQDGAADSSYDAHHHGAPMVLPGGLRLELHHNLFPPGHPFTDDETSVWLGRGMQVRWGDRSVRVLPAVWHLVHASIHWAWSHEGEVGTWQYLHDVRQITAQWDSDDPRWSEAVRCARTLDAAVAVGWALWTGARLGGVRVPEALLAELRGAPRPLTGIAERAWVVRTFRSPMASPSVAWSRYWWRYAMRGLGDASRDWPWLAGRMAAPAIMPTVGHGTAGATLIRWRRHLARVLLG